jgi:hypothetical protein
MADGWLFRLSSTLGAHQALPTWPSASERQTVLSGEAAATQGPVLRRGPTVAPDPFESEEAPPVDRR